MRRLQNWGPRRQHRFAPVRTLRPHRHTTTGTTMGNKPALESKALQRRGDKRARVGAASMQGKRPVMEDKHHIELALPSHPSIAYLAVFDGHCGKLAAEFMASEMHTRIDALADPTNHSHLTAAIERADRDFIAVKERREHGCTACIALIKTNKKGNRTLTVANVGDSRCLVINKTDGLVRFTTIDHKPDDPVEVARIKAAGGWVDMSSAPHGRVDGGLNLSRAIGDWPWKKQTELSQQEQRIVATPTCSTVKLTKADLVLLACDGVFEDLTHDQVSAFVFQQRVAALAMPDKVTVDPAAWMAALLDLSLKAGSHDNHSALLYVPAGGASYSREDEYTLGPIPESSDEDFVRAYLDEAKAHGVELLDVLDHFTNLGKDGLESRRRLVDFKVERQEITRARPKQVARTESPAYGAAVALAGPPDKKRKQGKKRRRASSSKQAPPPQKQRTDVA